MMRLIKPEPNLDLRKYLFDLKEGEVFGPYKDGNQFKLSRMMDFDRGGSVKARHILIAYEGSQMHLAM
ncbi:MAG: hypothetical protein CM15mP83_4800 [Flavobacteriaceae bacterium]|nr:MAG: hypothetical protein CM15mP83_4800 [Flavobacteriaceae bacterium]